MFEIKSYNKNDRYKLNKPSQKVPFPKNPELHEQLNDPILLRHVEFSWQSLVPSVHSFISKKIIKRIWANKSTILKMTSLILKLQLLRWRTQIKQTFTKGSISGKSWITGATVWSNIVQTRWVFGTIVGSIATFIYILKDSCKNTRQ